MMVVLLLGRWEKSVHRLLGSKRKIGVAVIAQVGGPVARSANRMILVHPKTEGPTLVAKPTFCFSCLCGKFKGAGITGTKT